MQTPITINSTVQQVKDSLLTNAVGDELVMMDLESGNYISLNKIGRVIWEQIDGPTKVDALIAALVNRFNVDEATCTADTLQYLESMYKQKVISLV